MSMGISYQFSFNLIKSLVNKKYGKLYKTVGIYNLMAEMLSLFVCLSIRNRHTDILTRKSDMQRQ